MSYKIVVDSCCELPPAFRNDPRFESVPLAIEIDSWRTMDDEHFDQQDFLRRVRETESCPKSACPSPDRYCKAYETEADDVFVVTLSSHLSGSYNSALLGKRLYEEEHGPKNIYICDSESACGGETQYALKAMELKEQGLSFEETVEELERFRDSMNTWFVLDSLEHLRRNGRLSNWKAFVATTLNIKPVCAGDKGVIVQKAQGIGMKKALMKMAGLIEAGVKKPEERTLIVSHCNCYERAMLVKDQFLNSIPFGKTMILDTTGIGSLYAQDGGIVVTY
ncbi:MAG: DegV family protein [Lachnospiraceae bacterium]|nr:DegV family protein [Lachnospiraceae bacterium]